MEKIFTTVVLSNDDRITVLEGKGYHLFQAALLGGMEAVNNQMLLSLYLLTCLCMKDGKTVDLNYIKNLPMSDVSTLLEIVSAQMIKI